MNNLPFSLPFRILFVTAIVSDDIDIDSPNFGPCPGLIFSGFFENLTIALKNSFSSSDFGSPAPLTSLYDPRFP